MINPIININSEKYKFIGKIKFQKFLNLQRIIRENNLRLINNKYF